MRELLRHYAQRTARAAGFTISRIDACPRDLDEASRDTIRFVRPYTLTTPERVYALCQAVRYVVANGIQGDIVECGVWRGGSMMAVARTLIEESDATRHLHLFDTFEGMVPPGPHDRLVDGIPAAEVFSREVRVARNSKWCDASLDEVRSAMSLTGYTEDRISYVQGRVEDTLPGAAPQRIAILRLDTDWYESTRHELVCLFPRLEPGGVLIVDDYGYWRGARRAVDEYLDVLDPRPLLTRIDHSARIAVVPGWPTATGTGSGPESAVREPGPVD